MGFAYYFDRFGFVILATICIAFYIAIFSVWADYEEMEVVHFPGFEIEEDPRIVKYYKPFIDVGIMVFVGFGFLMTFLRFYTFSAVGYTFFLSALIVPWAIICIEFFIQLSTSNHFHYLDLTLPIMIDALFAAASVMISFGAIIGKGTPLQYLVMAIIQVMVYACNFWLVFYKLQAVDIGGSMQIHAFGAYFGLACSWVFTKYSHKHHEGHPKATASPTSDTFAMVGTVFLWLCWPSFNSALAPAISQHRCIINTFLSLCASCVTAFIISFIFRKGKFSMVEAQNATLAGGVAIGSAADLLITPGGALGLGAAAGALSSFGFVILQPFFAKKLPSFLALHDSCGVHNLHGLPGVLAGVASIITTATNIGTHVEEFFPHGNYQSLIQFAALGTSVGMGIVGGLICGLVLRFLPYPQKPYEDSEYWVEEEEESHDGEKHKEPKESKVDGV